MQGLQIGNYVIILNGKKKSLAKIIHISSKIKVVLDNRNLCMKDTREVLEVEKSDVLANLFSNPYHGNVYSINVEPFTEFFQHKYFGEVFIHRDFTESERNHFIKTLDKIGKILKKKDFLRFSLTLEVRPPKGNTSGLYKYTPKQESDTVVLRFKDWKDLKYTLYHEFGHGIWYRLLSEKYKAKWIKKYYKSISLKDVDVGSIKIMRDTIINSKEDIKTIESNLDESDKELLSGCLDFISRTHYLNVKHIDLLKSCGSSLIGIWPKTPIELSDIESILSEYAKKSPEELWAEAFSFYMMGNTIPSNIEKLVKKSLKSL